MILGSRPRVHRTAKLRHSSQKLKRYRRIGIGILTVLYLSALFAEFLGPYDYLEQVRGEPSAPASSIHFFDEEGTFHLRPFLYAVKLTDPRSLTYDESTTRSEERRVGKECRARWVR